MLSDARDMEAARACVKLCREIGNDAAFAPYVVRETIPSDGQSITDQFLCDAAVTYWHQCSTPRMGADDLSVVNGSLAVHGKRLRVADGSILPRVTTGKTQAPCAIVGERAAEILHVLYGL